MKPIKTLAFSLAMGAIVVLPVSGPALAQSKNLIAAYGRYNKAYDARNFKAAEKYANIAAQLALKEFGPYHKNTATMFSNLGDVYVQTNRLKAAGEVFKRVLKIDEKLHGAGSIKINNTLSKIANLSFRQGRYARAVALFERAIGINERLRGRNHKSVSTLLNNLAHVLRTQGRFARAEPLFKRAVAIDSKWLGEDHRKTTIGRNNLAALYKNMGRYAEAEPLYRQAVATFEKTKGREHFDTALVIDNLGDLYLKMEQYAKAERLFKRSVRIFEKVRGPDNQHTAIAVNNLAAAMWYQRRHAEAAPLYKRALDIFEKTYGPNHKRTATALDNLAGAYYRLKRYKQALPLRRRALDILVRTMGENHDDTALTLNNIGELYETTGQKIKAESSYKRSLAIWQKIYGDENPATALAFDHLSSFYLKGRRLDLAIDNARAASRALIGHSERFAKAGGGAAGRSESSLIASRRHVFVNHVKAADRQRVADPSKSYRLALESFDVAQWASRTSASAALAQMAARFGAGDDALARLVRERQDLGARLAALDKTLVDRLSLPESKRNSARETGIRADISQVKMRIASISARLAKEFPGYADLATPKPLGVKETQALLGENEAVVRFLFGADEGYVWLVSRTDLRWLRLPVKRRTVYDAVQKLRQGLDATGGGVRGFASKGRPAATRPDVPASAQGLPFDLKLSYSLYRLLFEKLEPYLDGIRHLIIVPSGPLQSLPPAVLVTKKPERAFESYEGYRSAAWLIRKYALTVLPSVSSLRALRVFAKRSQGQRRPFIGFGNPVLKGEEGGGETARGARSAGVSRLFRGRLADVNEVRQLLPLPDTEDELRAIARSLNAGEEDVYVQRRAAEKILKNIRLDQVKVLAFATHGLVAGDLKGVAEPALVLTPPEIASAEDDGLLTASEVAKLKLDADWVLLSACNTAAGDRPGAEGLSGLARAFFYAGARSLLVSHWPVYSHAAVALTTGAFAAQRDNPAIGRSEALRRSILALMNDTSSPANAHPEVWAPFIIVGEGM